MSQYLMAFCSEFMLRMFADAVL